MIGIGCDYGGFELKKEIMDCLDKKRIAYWDYGTFSEKAVDYPVYAKKVCRAILN